MRKLKWYCAGVCLYKVGLDRAPLPVGRCVDDYGLDVEDEGKKGKIMLMIFIILECIIDRVSACVPKLVPRIVSCTL